MTFGKPFIPEVLDIATFTVVTQLVKKFTVFHATKRFISVLNHIALITTLSQMDPVHTLPLHFDNAHFKIIPLSMSRARKGVTSLLSFQPKFCMHLSPVTHELHNGTF
jgi:hypothetical protein